MVELSEVKEHWTVSLEILCFPWWSLDFVILLNLFVKHRSIGLKYRRQWDLSRSSSWIFLRRNVEEERFFFSFNFFKVRIRFVECENNGITLTSDSNNLTGLIVFNDNFVNLFFLISSLLFYSGHDLNTIVSIHLWHFESNYLFYSLVVSSSIPR